MALPVDAAMFVLQVIALVSGLMGNVFILTVNFIEWVKSSSDLSSCDLILTSLAFSNLGHLCLYFVIKTNPTLNEAFSSMDSALNRFFVVVFWLRCCSLWFATWYCVYCCVKIVRFTQPHIVRMTKVLLKNVHWLLLGSAVISLASCLPSAFNFEAQSAANGLSNFSIFSTRNVSVLGPKILDVKNTAYISNILFVFAIFTFSAIAILTTLCRHMKRMRQNAKDFSNIHMDATFGAVKTVAFLLLLYSAFYVTQCLRYLYVYPSNGMVSFASTLVVAYFPAINSVILIMGIGRLKKKLTRTLTLSRCFQREQPEEILKGANH
ncbi:taste receptor type 2 member 4-like [Pleurodeles waltl]|uniref:taste receptor type 2 member 4-like n=1 Tax=Pleurodeles waltl TaxID=8319 RepID=UPI0037097B80